MSLGPQYCTATRGYWESHPACQKRCSQCTLALSGHRCFHCSEQCARLRAPRRAVSTNRPWTGLSHHGTVSCAASRRSNTAGNASTGIPLSSPAPPTRSLSRPSPRQSRCKAASSGQRHGLTTRVCRTDSSNNASTLSRLASADTSAYLRPAWRLVLLVRAPSTQRAHRAVRTWRCSIIRRANASPHSLSLPGVSEGGSEGCRKSVLVPQMQM